MEYIVIGNETYRIDSLEEIRAAQAAMRAAGIGSVRTWACPYDTIEAAQASGWEGAHRNGGIIVADPGETEHKYNMVSESKVFSRARFGTSKREPIRCDKSKRKPLRCDKCGKFVSEERIFQYSVLCPECGEQSIMDRDEYIANR